MTKHRNRHNRAYAAGARDFAEDIKAELSRILPGEHRADLARVVDSIKDSRFRMPPAWSVEQAMADSGKDRI